MTEITHNAEVQAAVEVGAEDSQTASHPSAKKGKKKGHLPQYKAPFAEKGVHVLPNGLKVVTN